MSEFEELRAEAERLRAECNETSAHLRAYMLRASTAEAQRDAALAQVAVLEAVLRGVLALHQPRPNSVSAMYPEPLCSCGDDFPCETFTAAALADTTPPADDGTTSDADLKAWTPGTDGHPCPWREGDCAGHGPDGHRTRWCYCRRNALRYPMVRSTPPAQAFPQDDAEEVTR